MSRQSTRSKTTLGIDEGEEENHSGESSEGPPADWRSEMRTELRTAIEELFAQRETVVRPGPTEIDAEDVVSEDSLADLVKRFEAGSRSNKAAIRLAGISKEGNKQHFMDMQEIKEKLEEADSALKESKIERSYPFLYGT